MHIQNRKCYYLKLFCNLADSKENFSNALINSYGNGRLVFIITVGIKLAWIASDKFPPNNFNPAYTYHFYAETLIKMLFLTINLNFLRPLETREFYSFAGTLTGSSALNFLYFCLGFPAPSFAKFLPLMEFNSKMRL